MVKKFRFAVFSLLFVALVFAPAPNVQARQGQSDEKLSNLLEQDSVLVEAYLVQVNSKALYEAGVAVVPQKNDERVTVLKLLRCIAKPQNGRVISSATVALKKNEEAQTSTKKNHYIPGKDETGKTITIESYSTIVKFEVGLSDKNGGGIQKFFQYHHDGLSDIPDDKMPRELPPETISYFTQSSLNLSLNKPIIVSRSQNTGTSLFFILRAEIVK